MKHCCMFLFMAGMAMASVAQPDPDRTTLVKNSIPMSKWHENSFWATYEEYRIKVLETGPEHQLTIKALANVDPALESGVAFDNASRILEQRDNEIALMNQYFKEISSSNNGAIALLFLQAETLVTMMEEVTVYEGTPWHRMAFPSSVEGEVRTTEHLQLIFSKAFSLTADESKGFLETYTKYDEEKKDLLGEKYDVYSPYVGDPTEFTSTFSRRLGSDFIEVMKREVKLKKKYLDEMNQSIGPVRAAQFLAWEEYNSIIDKMSLWTEDDEKAGGVFAGN